MILNSIFRLTDMISGPLKKIEDRMRSTEKTGDSLASKMTRTAKSFTLVAAAASAVIAGIWGLANSTVETQQRLGELASVGITNMQALESAATNFSNNFAGTTKADFLAAAYDIKSGIASLSDEGVAEFTALAAATAKATKSTASEMTSLFATGFNIYRQQFAQMSDIQFGQIFSGGISASVKNFKTTGSQMAASISAIGAAATNAQVPLQEQLAVLGMLQGTMSGSEAGTKYKAFISKAASAGKELGLRFLDANKNLKAMPDILMALRSKYGNTIDAVEKMQLTNAFGTEEAVALIDLLYQRVGDLKTNISGLGASMQNGKQFTLEMAQTMNSQLGASMQKAGQRFHNLLEIVGGIFAPIVKTAVNAFSSIILWLQRAAQTMASSALGRGILNLAMALSVAVVGLFAFSAAVAAASFALPMLSAALAPIAGFLGAISWPIWVAVGAVVALYVAYRKNFGGMADTISGWWKKLSLIYRGVVAVFSNMKDGVGTVKGALAGEIKAAGLVGAVTTISKILYRIREFALGFITPFQQMFEGLKPIFIAVFTPLMPILRALGNAIVWVAGKLGITIASTNSTGWRKFGEIMGWVAMVIGTAFLGPLRIIGFVIKALRLLIGIPGTIIKAFAGVGALIVRGFMFIITNNPVTLLYRLLIKDFGRVAGVFKNFNMASLLTGQFKNLLPSAGFFLKFAQAAVNGLMFIVRNSPIGLVVRSISAMVRVVGSVNLSSAGMRIVATLMSGLRTVATAPITLLRAAFLRFTELLPMTGVFGQFAHRAVDGLMFIVRNNPISLLIRSIQAAINFISTINLADSGSKMISTLVAGMKQKIMSPVETVKAGFTKLRRLLPFSDAKEGPLSQLTKSGSKIMSTLAVGVIAASPLLHGAVEKGFDTLGINKTPEKQIVKPVMPPMPVPEPQTVPPVTIPTPTAPTPPRSKGQPEGKQQKGDGTTIIIQNLTLSGVADPEDFIKKLQEMVNQNG